MNTILIETHIELLEFVMESGNYKIGLELNNSC
jgi:hypothetical protein